MSYESSELSFSMTLEELKAKKQELEKINEQSLNNIKQLNDILLQKLEKNPEYPSVTEKTKKFHKLMLKLSVMIEENLKMSKSIEAKHESFKTLYFESKEKYQDNNTSKATNEIPEDVMKEFQATQAERDKALGLVKILLATLKSSREQSEENFHKLKYSSDLMFHIMYKAEDAFLGGEEC